MARRLLFVLGASLSMLLVGSAAAFACGGLVAPGHAEVLQKATTLAAWHAGYEHYVTGFQFAGTADNFGYIIPLPGVPTKIQKGGGWTLERLEREVNPVEFEAALAADAGVPAPKATVQVIQQVKIEALDITIVRGGGRDVAAWAARNGFDLTPDTPTVMGHYSSSGAIFALAKFDRSAAAQRGLIQGQGQTIHFTIPTKGPWIPLRILALGKVATEEVQADLFVMSDHPQDFAPAISDMPGMEVVASRWAGRSLLSDLRSDQGMSWVPRKMWFSALKLDTRAGTIGYDLSVDGAGPAAAIRNAAAQAAAGQPWVWWLTALVGMTMVVAIWALWRPTDRGLRPA
jgi:hypothetical protein